VQTEDDWRVLNWERGNVVHELSVLNSIRNGIVVLSEGSVEDVVGLEHCLRQPLLTVGNEELTIKIISDSATVLDFSYHVLNCLP